MNCRRTATFRARRPAALSPLGRVVAAPRRLRQRWGPRVRRKHEAGPEAGLIADRRTGLSE